MKAENKLTLHNTQSKNIAAYCRLHECHLTVKQIREHECLAKNCWHLVKDEEHPWWRYRENIKRIKKEKRKGLR